MPVARTEAAQEKEEHMAVITLSQIKKTYQTGKIRTDVLKGIDFELNEGEFVAITGRSGCGKSTLLNILGGMDRQSGGEYLFDGKRVDQLNDVALARFRNRSIGFVFQAFHLAKELNALDNVALPLGYAGVGKRERRKRADELLAQVGLADKGKSYPSQLSGGEQQRVAIARAIANRPKVLLADEPTGNLDQENGMMVMELLQRLHKEGLTIIMVTHDLSLAGQADRLIRMQDGKIVK